MTSPMTHHEMTRLHALLLRLHTAEDLQATLAELAKGMLKILRCAGVTIAVTASDDPADTQLEVLASAGARSALRNLSEPSAEPISGRRWLTRGRDLDLPTVWTLTNPSGAVVGELCAVWPQDATPATGTQRDLMQLVCAQVGAAVGNALVGVRLQQRQEQLRAEQEERRLAAKAFQLAFSESVIGMATISLDPLDAGRFLSVNDALCRLTGYVPEELLTRSFTDLTHPEDQRIGLSALRRAIAGRRTPFRSRKRYVRADGEAVWVQVTATPLFDDDDKPIYAITQVEDLRPRQDHESELAARQDPLTNLLNRPALTETMTDVMDRARRLGTTGAVLVLDLGEASGISSAQIAADDAMRLSVAQTLTRTLRDGDTISRISENQFVIVAEEVKPEHAASLARRISDALESAQSEVAGAIPIHASIGMTVLASDATDTDVVLRQAKEAMQEAKAAGTSYVLYSRPDTPPPNSTHVLYSDPGWKGLGNGGDKQT
jgi:PAS domain S-box-containing protein/diguanylate cyclase (GGDEF)-like protein